MATFLAISGWTLFGLALLIGLTLDLVGLFGNWVILGAVVAAWVATGFEHFGVWGIVILTGLAVLGEVFEMLAASYGAVKFGAGKGAMLSVFVGALAGAVLGTPWFPVVGTLIGACLGAFLAAVGYEYIVVEKPVHHALWTGLGAALGKVAGLFAKFLVGLVMLTLIVAWVMF